MKKIYLVILAVFLAILGFLAHRLPSLESDLSYLEESNKILLEEIESLKGFDPIVVYADSRTGHDIHRKIVGHIEALNPQAVFVAGDLVADGESSLDWKAFNEITKNLRSQADFWPAIGNHEGDGKLFIENFDLPNNERWYSRDIENIHFIILDTTSDLTEDSEQFAWLVNDLKSQSKKTRFSMAVFHHPPYSSGKHKDDEAELRDKVIPLFEKHGVDVVFSGHDHDYERLKVGDIHYIIPGSAGAPLYDMEEKNPDSIKFLKSYSFCVLSVNEDGLSINVYDENMNEIDSLILN